MGAFQKFEIEYDPFSFGVVKYFPSTFTILVADSGITTRMQIAKSDGLIPQADRYWRYWRYWPSSGRDVEFLLQVEKHIVDVEEI